MVRLLLLLQYFNQGITLTFQMSLQHENQDSITSEQREHALIKKQVIEKCTLWSTIAAMMPLKNHENSLSMNQRCMSRAAAGLVLKNLEQEKNGNPRKIKSSLGFHRISLVYQLQICIPTGCSEKKVMRLEHDAYASFVTLMANIFKITSWPL